MCYGAPYGEITELFVPESRRRRGVARGLVAHLEAEFRRRGIRDFQLFTGAENASAQAFYRSLGYFESAELMFRKTI